MPLFTHEVIADHEQTQPSSLRQQGIQPTLPVQKVKIVGSSNMEISDEYLWHGPPPTGARRHPLPLTRIVAHVNFIEWCTFLGQQGLGGDAVRAVTSRVYRDARHD
jgi:hypothetical protein